MKNYLFSGIINKEARQLLKKDLASANKLVAIAGAAVVGTGVIASVASSSS